MSLIKGITMEISGRSVQVALPDKKTIILRGMHTLHILHILECLLAQDFTGYYDDTDKQYGFNYEKIEGVSSVVFNNGAILSKDSIVQTQGVVPNIHVIRYLKGYTFRSFYLSSDLNTNSSLYTDLTKYSNSLQDIQWVRLITLVNNLVDFEFVKLENKNLYFDFDTDTAISDDGLKLIYSIIAECFLTPQGYSRVLLLPSMNVLSKDMQVKLMEILDNIKGHTLTLSLVDISPSEFRGTNAVAFLNV